MLTVDTPYIYYISEEKLIMRNTCCFLGHRRINETEELKAKLFEIITKLIVESQVDTFLFGSKSRFNSLCIEVVTEIKKKHPHINRIYVRAEYPYMNSQERSIASWFPSSSSTFGWQSNHFSSSTPPSFSLSIAKVFKPESDFEIQIFCWSFVKILANT